jgi:hypothetical protein
MMLMLAGLSMMRPYSRPEYDAACSRPEYDAAYSRPESGSPVRLDAAGLM